MATTMRAARLHGPRDLRIEDVPHPGAPVAGEALLRVTAGGICGSDLHTYNCGRIGDTEITSPLILGHEFAAVVEAVGPDALDGEFRPLKAGSVVAVDPAQPCGNCSMCERGQPNMCEHIHFCGLAPDGGCFCEYIRMPAKCCFPVPSDFDPAVTVMLEPLGIALHTVDLARVKVGCSVALIGAGPVGLCILECLRLAGAGPIFVSERLPWRRALAEKRGGIPLDPTSDDPVAKVLDATGGRGVDVAIEAAWTDESVRQATEMVRLGGTLAVVGISDDDRVVLKHSTVRRKGLTLLFVRRMKLTYPRAIGLAKRGAVGLSEMVSHRLPLERIAEAFAMNAEYRTGVVKIIVNVARTSPSA